MRIYICDDEQKYCELMRKYIQGYLDQAQLNAQLALVTIDSAKLLKQVETGLYFLGVDLGHEDRTGIDVATEIKKWDPSAMIVFVTHNQGQAYAVFDYRIGALDYILKSDTDRLKEKIIYCIHQAYIKYWENMNTKYLRIQHQDGHRTITLPKRDIMFVEKVKGSKKVLLHSMDQVIAFSATLRDIVRMSESFYFSHRSCVVNVRNIKEIDPVNKIAHFINGKSCTIARERLKILMEVFSNL